MPAHPDKPMRVCISCYDVLTKRPHKGQASADGAGASFNENDLKQIFLVALVSKTKEISTSKHPPPSPASNPNSFDQKSQQDIHENDEEDYQPFSSIQKSPSSKFVSDSNT